MAFADRMEAAPPDEGEMGAENGGKPPGDPLLEIKLCLYPGGKLAVALSDGEKHAVPDLETALTAIRRLAESEMREPGEAGGEGGVPPGEEEGEEAAMMRGYGG